MMMMMMMRRILVFIQATKSTTTTTTTTTRTTTTTATTTAMPSYISTTTLKFDTSGAVNNTGITVSDNRTTATICLECTSPNTMTSVSGSIIFQLEVRSVERAICTIAELVYLLR